MLLNPVLSYSSISAVDHCFGSVHNCSLRLTFCIEFPLDPLCFPSAASHQNPPHGLVCSSLSAPEKVPPPCCSLPAFSPPFLPLHFCMAVSASSLNCCVTRLLFLFSLWPCRACVTNSDRKHREVTNTINMLSKYFASVFSPVTSPLCSALR